VIKTVSAAGAQTTLATEFNYPIRETGWLVARSLERPDNTIRFAHSSPVYVTYGHDSGIVLKDVQFFIEWIDRQIAFFQQEPSFRRAEDRAAMIAFFKKARRVYEDLETRAK
jgi:hypothetical protein